jgi:hypothetical protein
MVDEATTLLRVQRSVTKDLVYMLENASNRLQAQATSCRGTVTDDWKEFGLQREADAIRQALQILLVATGK